MRTQQWSLVLAGTLLALSSGQAAADQFHYNNVIIGTRSVGLGGAFGAVADDAAGVYYNPAGLAFALSNDISGSANAFYNKSTTYKETICGDDFEEESSGSVPSFFGGLQKLDRYVEGLVFAFGVYSTDSDLKDQDTLIENKDCSSTTIERYHRTSNARSSTYFVSAGVGKRVTSNLALGVGMSYFNADELVQEFQGAKQSTKIALSDGSQIDGWRYLASNVREHLVVHGVQPVLGVQAALPGNLAVGLTYKHAFVASQRIDVTSETTTNVLTTDQKDLSDSNQATSSASFSESIVEEESKKPIGTWPDEVRLGLAWFASPTLLLALDFIHHTEVTDGDDLKANGGKPKYNREAVTDLAFGAEYYVAPAFPLRFGLFTNYDARPEIEEGTPDTAAGKTCSRDASFREKYCAQPDHIDYLGESLFIAWVQPNSQIAVGAVLQQGKGKAQKLGDHQVQDVEASSYTLAFSATYNL